MAQPIVRMDSRAVAALLSSEQGPVMRHIALRATRIQQRAKQQVGKRSRRLERSIVKRFVRTSLGASVWVGSDEPHALVHHEGSRPHLIEPKNARVLVFEVGGVTVYAARVNHPGTQPNRYLTDAAKAEGLRVVLDGSALGTGVAT